MNVAESPSRDQVRRDQSSGDITNIPLVDPHVRYMPVELPLSLPCFNTIHDRPNEDLAVPGPSRGSPSESSVLSLDNDLQSFLSNHLSKGNQKKSEFFFKTWTTLSTIGALSCPPRVIANYLKYLCGAGTSYNSVDYAQSAISKFHQGYNGSPAGQNQTIRQAVRAVFNLCFDASVVLSYLKSLGPNQSLVQRVILQSLFSIDMCYY